MMLVKKLTVGNSDPLKLQQTILAHALSLAFAGSALTLSMLLPLSVQAQSNATGTVFGQVPATPGLTIILENLASNAHRTITPDAQGKYQATSMPPGLYKVKLMQGERLEKSLQVEVLLGQGVEASFNTNLEKTIAGSENAGVQSVLVAAKINRIDVSNTNNGSIFTAKELGKLPMAQDVASIIQLAPGTVKNTLTGTYGNVASFGGASVSENAYYVNGFPVTNILTQVGASELPFGAIANAQVLSGGYGAEFGRSTGGVVNITTKSGSNQWEFGAKFAYKPNALRAAEVNDYFPNTGTHKGTDGKLQYYNQDNTTESKTAGLYLGGPLIKDKFFAFAALESTKTSSGRVASSSETPQSATGYSQSQSDLQRYLVKLDYHLSDNHHFEFTRIHDEKVNESQSFGFYYQNFQRDYVQKGGSTTINCCGGASNPGADDAIFKYTGYLRDDLTLTALYGQSRTRHSSIPDGYNPAYARTSSDANTRVAGLSYPKPQQFTDIIAPDAGDNQQTLRLDLEYTIGKHALRVGIDHNKVDSVVGKTQAGGREWAYKFALDPITGKPANPQTFKPFNAFETLAQGGGYGVQGYFVSENLTYNFARPTSTQSAQYIQDRYQISEHIVLDLGLRDEQFTNNNSAGQPIFTQKHQIAPRLGAAWDVSHDGSFKVFANAGRYFMQVPTNLSSNLAGVFVSTQKYYTYTGVDPVSGVPTGLHPISDVVSANNAFGKVSDPRGITAIDIKPLYQDEISLGFEKAFSNSINYGVMATYRKLKSSNDDFCDQRPINAWGLKNNYPDLADNYSFPCAVINPGEANSFWLDLDGNGKLVRVNLSAADMGLPAVKRTYAALNFFLEHPVRDGWYGKINYTYSQSKGNNEGQVDSTQGGDVGLTVGWDHKELMLGADGYLPNDRTHVIKAFGFYQLNPEWIVAGNLLLASGRPRNCTGNLPESVAPDLGYGSAYFYCHGVATPRGSQGRLPWSAQLDMNLAYQPAFLKGMTFKFDVFNLFNSHTINSENSDSASKIYLQGASRLESRSARLSAEYNVKF